MLTTQQTFDAVNKVFHPTNQKRRTYIEDDDQNLECSTPRIADLSSYMTNRAQLRNREAHNILKNNLIEHI